jgi:hypothetical protein
MMKVVARNNLAEFYCLRCNREIEAGQKSCRLQLQTVGISNAKSSAQQFVCPPCSVSRDGPPPEGALNVAAWRMLRDIVTSDPAHRSGVGKSAKH